MDQSKEQPAGRTADFRIAIIMLLVVALDQVTKFLVNRFLMDGEDRVIIDGFFKLVHWGNTGAAWSLFMGRNGLLAIVAVIALIVLYRARHHFDSQTLLGQVALGLIFGGIIGNLIDRIRIHHVTDFLYFYIQSRGGTEHSFPAFNIADSSICIGVFLIFILSLRNEKLRASPAQPPA